MTLIRDSPARREKINRIMYVSMLSLCLSLSFLLSVSATTKPQCAHLQENNYHFKSSSWLRLISRLYADIFRVCWMDGHKRHWHMNEWRDPGNQCLQQAAWQYTCTGDRYLVSQNNNNQEKLLEQYHLKFSYRRFFNGHFRGWFGQRNGIM